MLKMARTTNSPNNRLFTEIVSPEWWSGCDSRVVSSSSVSVMRVYLSDIASEKVDLGRCGGVDGEIEYSSFLYDWSFCGMCYSASSTATDMVLTARCLHRHDGRYHLKAKQYSHFS